MLSGGVYPPPGGVDPSHRARDTLTFPYVKSLVRVTTPHTTYTNYNTMPNISNNTLYNLLQAATGRIRITHWTKSDQATLCGELGSTDHFVVGDDGGDCYLMTRNDWNSTLERYRILREQQEADKLQAQKDRYNWDKLKAMGIPASTVEVMHVLSKTLTEEQFDAFVETLKANQQTKKGGV